MYLFSFILINFFIIFTNGKNSFNNEEEEMIKLIYQIIEVFTSQFEDVDKDSIIECVFDENFNNDLNFLHLLEFSGKAIGELGNKYDCENNNLTYFIIDFNTNFSTNDRYDTKTLYFLEQSMFFMAICGTNKCINNIIEIAIYKDVSKYLSQIFNLNNVTFYFSNKDKEIYEKIKNFSIFYEGDSDALYTRVERIENPKIQKIIFIILLVIISLYLFIIIIVSIYRISFYYSTKKSNLIKLKNKSKIKIESLNEKNKQDFNNESNYDFENSIFGSEFLIDDFIDKEDKFFKYFSNFDIIFNIQCLLSKNNIYFNNSNIEIVGFLRGIFIFLLVYCQIFLTTLQISQRDQFSEKFYKNILFSFIKLSGYVNICWIILDGIILGFKLINYIKKYLLDNNCSIIPLKIIFKFYLMIFPRVLIILFIYFFLYILSKSVSEIFMDDLMFDYYIINNISKKKCYNNPFIIFIPFYISYYKFKSYDYESCYKYVVIYSNEFYSMFLVGIILFFSIKLKNKIFDLVIFLFVVLNILLFHIYYIFSYEKMNENVTFLYILGQTYSERYFHLMINYYFIGFFLGLTLFYYKDSMSKTNIKQILNYTPFSFCSDLILKVSNFKNITKKIISLSIFFILLIIPSSFSIYNLFFNYDNTDNYGKENNIFLKLCNIYEKNVFAIFFSFLIIFLIVIDEDSPLSKLINSNFFVLFERINFEYFCCIEFIIYVNFSVFHYNLTLTHQNLFYTTIGFAIFANLITMAIIILFELPLRKFTKDFIKNYLPNENKRSKNISTIASELNKPIYDNNIIKKD